MARELTADEAASLGIAAPRELTPSQARELGIATAPPPAPAARSSAKDIVTSQLADETPSEPLVALPGPFPATIPASSAPQPPTDDQLKARAYGAAQGASYGLADDAVGLGYAITGKGSGKFWDRFKQGRQGHRDELHRLQGQEPDDYNSGQFVGALMQPSAGPMATTALGRIAIGAGEGAAAGVLGSEKDTAKGVIGDGAVGLGIGTVAALPAAAVMSKPGPISPPKTLREQILNKFDLGRLASTPVRAAFAAKDAAASLGQAAANGSPVAKVAAGAMKSGVTERELRQVMQDAIKR